MPDKPETSKPPTQAIPLSQVTQPWVDAVKQQEIANQERHKETSGFLGRIASSLESLTGGKGSLEEVTVALEIAARKKPFQKIIDVIKSSFSITDEEIAAEIAAKKQ